MLTRQDDSESSTESTSRGRENNVESTPLAFNLLVDQCRSGVDTPEMESYPVKSPLVVLNCTKWALYTYSKLISSPA
jgi:hypothetical protein